MKRYSVIEHHRNENMDWQLMMIGNDMSLEEALELATIPCKYQREIIEQTELEKI